MAEPSSYELDAWNEIQQFRGRQFSRRIEQANQKVAESARAAGDKASELLERHPRLEAARTRSQAVTSRGAKALRSGARSAAGAAPWLGEVTQSATRTTATMSRAGLSPKRVVAKHQKRGHDVMTLRDLRSLDLEQLDAVRGRSASWLYPAGAALSGAGAAVTISGGQLVTVASAGAGAAPSAPVIMGAVAVDAAAVLALASRAVGRTALMYGYDPETPAEKLFILSVINVGTAATTTAKSAAFKDLSKLTQALVRGKTWNVLNESVVSRVVTKFASSFTTKFTQKSLGKVVPAAGIAIGGSLNWATIEGIVDAADVSYRRRFLLEKYPQLADNDDFGSAALADDEVIDVIEEEETFSVIAAVAEEGGPELD